MKPLTSSGSAAAAPGRPPDALASWPEITRRLERRRLAVFLDYDGTLTPIVERPDAAVLPDEMRTALQACATRWPTVIVSGRGRDDVAALVGLETLIYAGSHGFDVAGPAGSSLRLEIAADIVPRMSALAADIRVRTRHLPGVVIEDKRFSLAVHYRLVQPERVPELDAIVGEMAGRDGRVRRSEGKKVFELRPAADWDKGQAVLWLLGALDLAGPDVVPVFVGDDLTDEDAFRALDTCGLTVVVMEEPRPTAAQYSLRGIDDVRQLLDRLTQHAAPPALDTGISASGTAGTRAAGAAAPGEGG